MKYMYTCIQTTQTNKKSTKRKHKHRQQLQVSKNIAINSLTSLFSINHTVSTNSLALELEFNNHVGVFKFKSNDKQFHNKQTKHITNQQTKQYSENA